MLSSMPTTTPKRTDIHRPSAPEFDPQAYRLVDVYDLHWESQDHKALSAAIEELEAQGVVRAPHAVGCGHCGQTNMRYVALLAREDVKQWIFVGQDCLAGRFVGMTKAKFDALRRQAELDRKKQKVLGAWREFRAANPEFPSADEVFLIGRGLWRHADELGLSTPKRWGDDHLHAAGVSRALGTAHDIARKARIYGTASEKQVAFVSRLLVQTKQKWDAYVEAEVAKLSLPPTPPVPEGRQIVEGVVLSFKVVDGYFEGQHTIKMLVQADEGWRVFGTRSAALGTQSYQDDEGEWKNTDCANAGDRVRFTATLSRSEDEDFGFFKTPRSAVIVERASTES
jgi:hypothetical protein